MEDNQLKARIKDLAEQCGRQHRCTLTGFLTPAEQVAARAAALRSSCHFRLYGGYPEAERQVLLFQPDYLADNEPEWAEYLHVLQLVPAAAGPGHRDYLGALLALGIRRDQLGDILVEGKDARIVVLAGISGYLAAQLERVGPTSVSIFRSDLASLAAPEIRMLTVQGNVASLRLDNVAAEGFSLPRSRMAELIRSGQVQLNWAEELRPDHLLEPGDLVSLRGFGRLRLVSIDGKSRKDRFFITMERPE